MEALIKERLKLDLTKYFLKEAKPFTSKREVEWGKFYWVGIGFLIFGIFLIIAWPTTKPEEEIFIERVEKGSLTSTTLAEKDFNEETLRQFQDSRTNAQQIHNSLDYLYRQDSNQTVGSGATRSGGPDRNTGMILSREGTDSRTQLSPGARVSIRLSGSTTISNQGMPIVGVVSKDVKSDSGVAIPSGSKVLGDATFDEESERASITWRSIILPDGRERPFSAIGIDSDGQVGIGGRVHSNGMKNAVGQTLTRFVGAYASGAMSTGMFGSNRGGNTNGIRNAIAQTATDRANTMGEDLQKEKKWIELKTGSTTLAVLNQPFAFRDAGNTYGR